MISALLKQLGRALSAYIRHHAKRIAGTAGRRNNGAAVAEPAPSSAPSIYHPVGSFDWQALSEQDSQLYVGGPSPSLLDLFAREPRFILDVGCSVGDFAATAKQRFPKSKVWGVEPNKRAAAMAARRIDHVISQPVDEIDWRHERVTRGDIDAVLLFDVLEHIYDPWKTLLILRNLVAETAQLLVSIPNVRNALLIQDLVAGHWRYRRAGLLDITHIRFFTRNDMYRMFYQTGFRVTASAWTQCANAVQIFGKNQGGPFPRVIELESASITVHSREDLVSLCTLQHIFTLQPVEYDRLSDDERKWIDDPHPPTLAFAPEFAPL